MTGMLSFMKIYHSTAARHKVNSGFAGREDPLGDKVIYARRNARVRREKGGGQSAPCLLNTEGEIEK